MINCQRIFVFLFLLMGLSLIAEETDTLEFNKYHIIADSLFQIKSYDAAIKNYERASKTYHSGKEWENEVICLNALAIAHQKNRDFDKAIETLNKSLDLGLTHLDQDNELLADIFDLKGRNYYYKGDYYKAVFSEQEAVKRWEIIFGEDDYKVAKGYNNLAIYSKRTGKFDEALEYNKKALNISEKVLDSLDPRISSIINNLSTLYKEKGDYDEALKYSKRAIRITLNTKPLNSNLLAKKYHNIGMIYIEINDTLAASKYYKMALDLRLSTLKKDHPDLAASYNSMGKVNKIKGKYNIALDYYYQALRIYKKIYKGDHPDIATCYINISSVYKELGDYEKAISFNSIAFNIRSGFYRDHHSKIARCYLNYGDIYHRMGDYDMALKYLDRAISANTLNGETLNYKDQILILSKLSDVYISLFEKKTNDTLDLIKATGIFNVISEIVDEQRKSFTSKGSMIEINKSVSGLYREAVRVASILYKKTNNKTYLETAFFFAEKNKANVLVEAILESRSQTYSGILDNLIKQEEEIKLKLQDCDNKRKREIFSKGKRDKGEIKKIEKEFAMLNKTYDSLITVFEKNYQNYFLLKYSTSTISVIDVQRNIPVKSVMIEYLVSDSNLYIFVITKQEFSITQMETSSINFFVANLRKSLSELNIKSINNNSISAYCNYANSLYNLLLKPIEDKIEGKDLIIIPDGKLGHIPFEVLLTEQTDISNVNFKKLPYLIKKHSISYGNSATIQFDLLSSLKCNAKEDFLGFAPFTKKSDNFRSVYNNDTLKLGSLPSSKNEVESIQKLIGGKVFEDLSATKQNFISEAANYKILHIATHGMVDDKRPLESCLFFFKNNSISESELKIEDLFSLTFNSELAVLSACNTGYGKLEKGEGIMSLARGFSYAGVPSITMSLWNVNDKSTSKIMNGFYHYLKQGSFKNEALRQAKLDYIEQSDKIFATPYYWGGFVFIGKNDPIDFNGNRTSYWFLLLIIPVFAIGFFYKNKKMAKGLK